MSDLEPAGPGIQNTLLEIVSDAVSGALLVYDRDDRLVFASAQANALLQLSGDFLRTGTRMRDLFGALFDTAGGFHAKDGRKGLRKSREDWVAEQIASLWKERAEHFERSATDRWVSYYKRRLPTGYGVCVIRDVSEQKKREEQWRIDIERVQVTEEILDELPFAISVKGQDLAYVGVNKAYCRLVGLASEDILGRSSGEVFSDAIARRIDGADRQVIANGISIVTPERLQGRDGGETTMIVRKFRIGRPGRHFAVTAMEDLSSLADEDLGFAAMKIEQRVGRAEDGVCIQQIAGKRVLVITADDAVASEALARLGALGADASVVGSAEELEIFLAIAGEEEVAIDLFLLDSELSASCRHIAERQQVSILAMDRAGSAKDLRSLFDELFGEAEDAPPVAGAQVPADRENLIDVLVAEDNPVNQIVFSQILEGFGYRYAIAANGEEAVRLWQEKRPRIVLMDVTLPEINGFEACRIIRSLEDGAPAVPVIGVLAQPFDHDRKQCFAAGMDGVILKPLSPEMLEGVFATHLHEDGAVAITA